MKEIIFTGYEGKELVCYVWDEVAQPKGVVQLVHGMTSHMGRFDDFARELNKNGYIAFGDDHRPHGKTAGLENLGKAGKHNFYENLMDEIAITAMLREKYALPVLLFAHSYGSFLAQRYLVEEGGLLDGVLLSGSAHMGRAKLAVGRLLTAVQRLFYKMEQPNNMMFNMAFKSNNKPFAGEGLDNAWLCRDADKVKLYNADPYCNFIMTHGFYYSMTRELAKAYRPRSLAKIRKDLPIYVMSGARDPLGGMGKKVVKLFETYKKHGLDVRLKIYEDARHELVGDPEKVKVIADITAFFDECIKKR
ncbi:MAG: alpha/beta fold hydrolase [Clostridia bacterium]|nr:alpha/beta fold hydrolase [Clostridia bacterium]